MYTGLVEFKLWANLKGEKKLVFMHIVAEEQRKLGENTVHSKLNKLGQKNLNHIWEVDHLLDSKVGTLIYCINCMI